MNISEIRNSKDLRKVKFSELFYDIYDEDNAESTAMGIIGRIKPDFEVEYKTWRMEAVKYDQFRMSIEEARAHYEQSIRNGIAAITPIEYCNENIRQAIQKNYGADIQSFFGTARFGVVFSYLYEEYVSLVHPQSMIEAGRSLIDEFVKENERYQEFCKELNRRIRLLVSKAFKSDKVIEGLFLLPHLDTDQRLIVFFGNSFRTTLDSVDAYTGLLYATEYFEADEQAATLMNWGFTQEEYSQASADDACKLKSERRLMEEKAALQMQVASYKSALSKLEGGDYEEAQRTFMKLGDYRDSKDQLQLARQGLEKQRRAARAKQRVNEAISGMPKGDNRLQWRIQSANSDTGRVTIETVQTLGEGLWPDFVTKSSDLDDWFDYYFKFCLPDSFQFAVKSLRVVDESRDKWNRNNRIEAVLDAGLLEETSEHRRSGAEILKALSRSIDSLFEPRHDGQVWFKAKSELEVLEKHRPCMPYAELQKMSQSQKDAYHKRIEDWKENVINGRESVAIEALEASMVKWTPIAIDVKRRAALIISEMPIAYLPFDKRETTRYEWRESTLRQWLNGRFLQSMPDVVVNAIISNDEQDHIFILSPNEAKDYQGSIYGMACADSYDGWDYVDIWLRTDNPLRGAYIHENRAICYSENDRPLPSEWKGVRPAFWILLDSLIDENAIPNYDIKAAGYCKSPYVIDAARLCEDGDFYRARQFAYLADAVNSRDEGASIVGLMAELGCRTLGQLLRYTEDNFFESKYYLDSPNKDVGTLAKISKLILQNKKEANKREEAMKRLEDQINGEVRKEVDRKIRDVEAEAEREYKEALQQKLRAWDAETKREVLYIKETIEKLLRERSGLVEKKKELVAERSALGLFATGKKKELDRQIAEVEQEIAQNETTILKKEADKSVRQAKQMPQSRYPAKKKSDNNGVDRTLWRVLSINEDERRALILACDCVATMDYHDVDTSANRTTRNAIISWETCSLRSWLNDCYYRSLPHYLRDRVIEVENENPHTSITWSTKPTMDKVFILSRYEVMDYLDDRVKGKDNLIACYRGEPIWWWLRCPSNQGHKGESGAMVTKEGYFWNPHIDWSNGYASASPPSKQNPEQGGVRPAMWIKID